MSDPQESPNSADARVEEQDGAVRDVDSPDTEKDTVSGGAPEDPDTPEEVADPEESENGPGHHNY